MYLVLVCLSNYPCMSYLSGTSSMFTNFWLLNILGIFLLLGNFHENPLETKVWHYHLICYPASKASTLNMTERLFMNTLCIYEMSIEIWLAEFCIMVTTVKTTLGPDNGQLDLCLCSFIDFTRLLGELPSVPTCFAWVNGQMYQSIIINNKISTKKGLWGCFWCVPPLPLPQPAKIKAQRYYLFVWQMLLSKWLALNSGTVVMEQTGSWAFCSRTASR